MAVRQRKTFQEILREEAPRNAGKLETKARSASWLAKIQPKHSSELYSIKHDALRQLFRMPEHTPVIRDAWVTGRGFLLSVRLRRSHSLLHMPFDELKMTTQQAHGTWVAQRARGRSWRRPLKTQRPVWEVEGTRPARDAR
jgi:hypothetical protein